MAAYRWVYDSRHLQADRQEPGSAPEPYARLSSMGYLFTVVCGAGDKDADGGGDAVWRVLATAARVQHHSGLRASSAQRGPAGGEQHRRRRLYDRALARHEQQLRQPYRLRLPQRQL